MLTVIFLANGWAIPFATGNYRRDPERGHTCATYHTAPWWFEIWRDVLPVMAANEP